MTYLSDAHHFRKLVAGACMVIAPLLVLVSEVIHPAEKSSSREQLTVIARHLDRWYAAHLIALVAIALLVPAVLGLMHMLRERQVAWGHVGGGLALLGLLAVTGIVAVEGFVGWQAAAGGDRAQMVALFDRLTGTAGLVLPTAWRSRLGPPPTVRTVEMETADHRVVTGEVCGPVRIQIEGFDTIFNEVTFGEDEPLLGYIILEQSRAAVDPIGQRLVRVKYYDLK